MEKRRYIAATIFGVLIISFLISYTFITFYNELLIDSLSLENQFYSQKFEPETKKIFFIGSSFGARLNGTLINQELENNHFDYTFYNLAKSGKYVTARVDEVEKILETKPDVIIFDAPIYLYGYTVQKIKTELNPTENVIQVYDVQKMIKKYFTNQDYSKIFEDIPNPKFVTLTTFKKSLEGNEEKLYPRYSDKPFYDGPKDTKTILTNKKLRQMASYHEFVDESDRFPYFKQIPEIIKKFQKENIKVIVFVPPHSKEYLNLIPEEKKQDFLLQVDLISQENDVPVYNLLENYENDAVWSNLDHVAINPIVKEYSNDISKIIIQEIGK